MNTYSDMVRLRLTLSLRCRPPMPPPISSCVPIGSEYDGGDCCVCTCVDTPEFTCGDEAIGGFACLDPSAPCVDDDDITTFPEDTTTSPGYTSTFQCDTGFLSDGDCDSSNNRKECGASPSGTQYMFACWSMESMMESICTSLNFGLARAIFFGISF